MTSPDDILTISDAARLLGLSASRVRQLVDNGQFPAQRTMGGVRLISRRAVERLVVERTGARLS